MTIDWWTLGIQAVNVLVLVWLLGHFFWKPVASMIALRRVTAAQTLVDAESMQAKAGAALADIERTRAGFVQERDAILDTARADAELHHAARMKAASDDAEAIASGARTAAEKDKQDVDEAWRQRANGLALDIAVRLCTPLAGAALQALFLDRLLERIASLPDAERKALAAGDSALEAVCAVPLDAAEEDRIRTRIAQAFGGGPPLVFSTDPALVAGLELRGPHLRVSNSWRADLAFIGAGLAHDDRV